MDKGLNSEKKTGSAPESGSRRRTTHASLGKRPGLNGRRSQRRVTLGERMLKLAGICKGLPSDLSLNHYHYLHGRPKR